MDTTAPLLTAFDVALIADFLSIAEDAFSNRSCNDFPVPATAASLAVLAPMIAEKIREYGAEWEDERDPENYLAGSSTIPGQYVVFDEWIAGFLFDKYKAAPPERIAAAELLIVAGLLRALAEVQADDDEPMPFRLSPTAANKAFAAAVLERRKKRAQARKALEATTPIEMPDAWVIDYLAHRAETAASQADPVPVAPAGLPEEEPLVRLGVAPRFPSMPAFLKQYSQPFEEWQTEQLVHLERFAREGPGFAPDRWRNGYGLRAATEDLRHSARAIKRLAIHAALGTGKPARKKTVKPPDAAATNKAFARFVDYAVALYDETGALASALRYFGNGKPGEDDRARAAECDAAISQVEYTMVCKMLEAGHLPEHLGPAMRQLAPYLKIRKRQERDAYIASTIAAAQTDDALLASIAKREAAERGNSEAAHALSADWRPGWQRAVAFDYWSCRLAGHVAGNAYGELGLDDACCTIANCLVLGWDDWALRLAREVFKRVEQGQLTDFDGGKRPFHARRTQYFVLRLIADWQGWAPRRFPVQAFDEPLFDLLLRRWRDPDLEAIAAPLLAACDRRTHQSRHFTGAKVPDLDDYRFWYDPFEILLVLALRRRLGLDNPVLDHPLMATPLGRLPEPAAPYTDELLDGVVARAREDYASL